MFMCTCFFLPPQEQRIRASHNIRKLSQSLAEKRLKVADRITKGMGIKRNRNGRGGTVAAAAAAAAGGGSGSSSSGEGSQDTGNGNRAELADIIRKNGEEIATSVEIVVEKVRHSCCRLNTACMICGGLGRCVCGVRCLLHRPGSICLFRASAMACVCVCCAAGFIHGMPATALLLIEG